MEEDLTIAELKRNVLGLIESNLVLTSTNDRLSKTNKVAVKINEVFITLIHDQKEKIEELLQLCGATHSLLSIKINQTWEEEELCKKLYAEITGVK